MKKLISLSVLTTLLPLALSATKPVIPPILDPNIKVPQEQLRSTFERTGPTIQLAILLDTSGSMNGLINQARGQIWKIINEVSKANKNNKDITLQVALFEYGKSSISKHENYLQMLSPLTNDLDNLSAKLFGLGTNGGEEYAGATILSSINRLQWSNHPDDLKLIVIAGNESFAQGPIPYNFAIDKATKNNIKVNTIFCGDYNQGIAMNWKSGAELGKGKYMNINQNDKVQQIITPYDDNIYALNQELNSTYIGYGQRGLAKKEMQKAQDSNSMKMSKSVAIERVASKVSGNYNTSSWDIVSLNETDSAKADEAIAEIETEEFAGKNIEEKKEIVKQKSEKRTKIQLEIKDLNKKREEFIASKQKESSKDLGNVLVKNIKDILVEEGFKLKK